MKNCCFVCSTGLHRNRLKLTSVRISGADCSAEITWRTPDLCSTAIGWTLVIGICAAAAVYVLGGAGFAYSAKPKERQAGMNVASDARPAQSDAVLHLDAVAAHRHAKRQRMQTTTREREREREREIDRYREVTERSQFT